MDKQILQLSLLEYFNNLDEIVIVSEPITEQIIYINPAFNKITGYSLADITGLKLNSTLIFDKNKIKDNTVHGQLKQKQGKVLEGTFKIHQIKHNHKQVNQFYFYPFTQASEQEKKISTKDNILQLANYIGDALWTMNLDGKLTYISPQIFNVNGYRPEELLSADIYDILPHDSYKKVTKLLQEKLPKEIKGEMNTPVRHLKIQQYKKNGQKIWTEVIVSPIRDKAGMVIEIIGISKNIQEQVETKQKLEDTQFKYHQLYNQSPEAMVQINKFGFLTAVNEAFIKISGFKKEEIINKHFSKLKIFDAQQLPKYIKIFTRLIQGKDVKPYEYTWKDATNKPHVGIAHIRLVKSNNKIEGIQVITSDITDAVLSQEKFEKSEQKYRHIFQNSPLGIMHYDTNGVITDCNDKFVKIIGSSKKDLIGLNMLTQLKDLNIIENVRKSLTEGKGYYEDFYHSITADKITPVRAFFEGISDKECKITGGIGLIEDITDRKRAEIELKKSERKFRSIFNNAPLGFLLYDKNSKILDCNQRFADMAGSNKNQLIGINIFNDLNDEQLKQSIKDSLTHGYGNYEGCYESIFANKSTDVRILFAGIKNETEEYGTGIGLVENITERKKAERNLMESFERLKIASRVAGIDFWRYDFKTLEMLIANNNTPQLNEENYSGRYNYNEWRKFIHPDDRNARDKAFESYIQGDTDIYQVEFRIRENDNQYAWIISTGKVIEFGESGQPLIMTGIHFKVTGLRKIEQELIAKNNEIAIQNEQYIAINEELQESLSQIQKINQELIDAKNKAEQSDRLKTAFLQNMSHEIRTPMNGILGFAELLEVDQNEPEKRKQYIEIINKNSHQLLSVVNDILDISKIETGQLRLNLKKTDLHLLIMDVYQFYLPQFKEKQIDLTYKIAPQLKFMNTDEGKLKQILNNIISNSLKYTHQGEVNFGYTKIDNQLKFYVKDTGIGIKAELIDLIFKRFGQAHSGATKKYGGTGLGLSISKGLIEIMGGKIWVNSTVNKGSEFIFTLPCKNENLTNKPAVNTNAALKKTILVVEDEDSNFMYLQELLKRPNLDVIRAKNGIEAIEIYKEEKQFDLVLMDIRMPVLDGLESTKEILKLNKNQKIIAQTACAFENDKVTALKAGCIDYLSKPINKNEFITLINKHL